MLHNDVQVVCCITMFFDQKHKKHYFEHNVIQIVKNRFLIRDGFIMMCSFQSSTNTSTNTIYKHKPHVPQKHKHKSFVATRKLFFSVCTKMDNCFPIHFCHQQCVLLAHAFVYLHFDHAESKNSI